MKTGWQVLRASVSERNCGLYVEGINHETTDPMFRTFFWHVGKDSLKDTRFDFSGCEFAPGALTVAARLLEG